MSAAASQKILVVDDSPTLRRVVSRILRKGGFDPVCARDGVDALKVLKKAKKTGAAQGEFSLALVDFVMPRMTGYELCRRLRADKDLAELPVVLMSAKAEKIRDKFVTQTGALDAITKPFEPKALHVVVEESLRKAKEGKRKVVAPDEMAPESQMEPPVSHSGSGGSNLATKAKEALALELARLAQSATEERTPKNTADWRQKFMELLTTEKLTKLASPVQTLAAFGETNEVLRGRSDAVPLGEVLQVLQMQRQSGVLDISFRGASVRTLFRDGLIDGVNSSGVKSEFRLGRYFLAEGVITKAELESSLSKRAQAKDKPLLGTWLVSEKVVSAKDLQAALARQASELVYEALRWPRATYTFTQTSSLEYGHASLQLPVAGLVMEGFRRVDEWRQIEAGLDFDLALVVDGAAVDRLGDDGLTATESGVLKEVDGKRTIQELVDASHLSSFEICRILHQLIQSRLVRKLRD